MERPRRMADRPSPVAAIALLATAAATTHAALGLLVNLDLPEVGFRFAAIAAGLLIAGVALFLVPNAVALLLHWIGLGAAALGATWAAASAFTPRDVDGTFFATVVLAVALVWNAWYALQWWLGGNPSRFLVRMGLGYYAAAAANLAYIPFELMDKIYLFLADDAISAAAFSLAGFFLVRFGKQNAPPPTTDED